MPVRFRCTFCNTMLSIGRRKVGTIVDCPKCKQKVTVPKPGERPETLAFEDEEFADFLVGDGGPLAEDPGKGDAAPPEPKPPAGELVGTGPRARSPRARRLAKHAAKGKKQAPGPTRESSRKAQIDMDTGEKELDDKESAGEELAERELPQAGPGKPQASTQAPDRAGKKPDGTDRAASGEQELGDDDLLDDVEIVEEPPKAESRPAPPPAVRPAPTPPRPVGKPVAEPAPLPPDPAPVDTPAIDALLDAQHRRTGVKVLKAALVVLLMVLMYAGGFLTSHFGLIPLGGGGQGADTESDAAGGGVPRIRGQISFVTPGTDRMQPDFGARLVLLARDRTPAKDEKIGWEGLATEPVPNAADGGEAPSTRGAAAVESLGGYVATADVEGTYELGRLKPGDYHLLVISANLKRPPDQPIDDANFDLLGRYFQGVKLILGRRAYELRKVQVRENEDITFNHPFGESVPPKRAPAPAEPLGPD